MINKGKVNEKMLLNNEQKQQSVQEMKLNGFVGFDSLPYQLVHKCQNNGYFFSKCYYIHRI